MHNSIALVFYTWSPENISSQFEKFKSIIYRLRIQASLFLKLLLLSSRTPASDGTIPGDFGCRAEMSVRDWKGGFRVDTL